MVEDTITEKCNGYTEKRRAEKQIITLARSSIVIFQSAFCKLLWQKVTERLGQWWVRQLKNWVMKEKRLWEVVTNSEMK